MPKSSERPPRRPHDRKDTVAPASKTNSGVWPQQAAKKPRDDRPAAPRAAADKPVYSQSSGVRRERPASAGTTKPARSSERHTQGRPAERAEKSRKPAPRNEQRNAEPRNAPPRKTEPRVEAIEPSDGVIERKLYGVNACLSFLRLRSDDIIRAYFLADVARQHFGPLMKQLAETRRAYHIVEADEMEKVTESTHHEGVCLLVRDAPVLRIGEWLTQAHAPSEVVLALEDVGNPHNLGAIMRTAAHFGVAAIVMSGAERLRSGAAMRTAAGGAENVPLVEATEFIDALKTLKSAGYAIVTTSSHKGMSVFAAPWPSRACIVMGEEQRGVSRAVQALADQSVLIPGTGAVESLNVSVATAIVVAQCANAQQEARRTPGTLRKPKAK